MTRVTDAAESPSGPGPNIAAILVTLDGYATIATTLKYLRAQTIAKQVELVLVAPRAQDVHVPPEDLAAFHAVRIAAVPDVKSLSVARMAGVRAASAPLVVFTEDHSFPEPGWAAALVDAHRRGYAGVAPQMKNANPDSSLSAAAMYLHFGGAVEPDGGETRYPAASHNMSFSRAALLELGDRLADLMLAEVFLHEELHRRGHRFWVEPSAVTRHVNMSRLRPAPFMPGLAGDCTVGCEEPSAPGRCCGASSTPADPHSFRCSGCGALSRCSVEPSTVAN